MPSKDISEKMFESHNDTFADIINVLLYNGKQIINPKDLETVETHASYKADEELRESIRDVAKIFKNQQYRIAFYGIENQTNIDKYMPFRILGYDGITYLQQLKELKKSKDKNKKLYPVRTIVLYFGKGEWKSPLSLYDYFEERNFSNYKIKVISLSTLPQKTINKFKSDFRIVADFIANHNKTENYSFPKHPINHTEDLFNLLEAFTGDNRYQVMYNKIEKQGNKEGEFNMDDFLDKYIKRKVEEGLSQGLSQGVEQGIEQGTLETSISTARKMLETGKLTLEEVAECSNLSLDKVKELSKEVCVKIQR